MLDAAHSALKSGIDVVAGYVEPHMRPETIALLEGVEIIPPLKVGYKGIILNEFDLDGALKRNPKIILVDELAHTNAEGMRHTKRYSDIEELLDAGIDVYTTINVQHIESLNDIVASITHVVVKERIPDRIFNEAQQVELIDIEPTDLIERLNEGKIYRENQAERALNNFFSKENLAALREIALRKIADRVNKEVVSNKNKTEGAYYTNENILVCLSAAPSNAKVIRTAARMAEAFNASFTALFVETINSKELNKKNIQGLRDNRKLAEDLGASISTTYGDDIPYQIAEFAKISGISKIIIGRTKRKNNFFGSKLGFVDKLMDLAPELDIYVIPDNEIHIYEKKRNYFKKMELSFIDIIKMSGIMVACTIISLLFASVGFSEANIITVFILGVLIISNQTKGRTYGAVSSLIGVLLFNFFFTEPKFTFNAYDSGYIVTFIIMLIASIITTTLTTRVKNQADTSAVIAYRTKVLLDANRELQKANNLDDIALKAQSQIYKFLNKPVIFYTVAEKKILKCYTYKLEEGDKLEEKYTGADENAVVALGNKK